MSFWGELISQSSSFTTRGSSNSSTPELDKTNFSGRQRETLESFRKAIKKIREENGNSVEIFRNEDQLYEVCAGMEEQSFRCGRDLLLTIFMKQIPQIFANIFIANKRVYWDAETEEILTDELGMNREFAQNVLKILKEELELETKKISSSDDITDDPWKSFSSDYPENSEIYCKIIRILDYGVIVQLAHGIEGLIPISKLAVDYIMDPTDAFKIGDRVPAVVTEIDQTNHMVYLSVIDYFKNRESSELRAWMEKHSQSRR